MSEGEDVTEKKSEGQILIVVNNLRFILILGSLKVFLSMKENSSIFPGG